MSEPVGGVYRGLAVSRSLGDRDFKVAGKPPMVSPLPDVTRVVLTPDSHFFILASDGLWCALHLHNRSACSPWEMALVRLPGILNRSVRKRAERRVAPVQGKYPHHLHVSVLCRGVQLPRSTPAARAELQTSIARVLE
jgi:hypothetical protein